MEYNSAFLVNRSGLVLRESPSYDKYGRIFLAAAADYSLTPALTFRLITNFSWTDTKVDTKANYVAGAGIGNSGAPFAGGLERYLGNEWVGGLTYRFAPNVTFDLALAALIVGDALNIHNNEAKNAYRGSARIRVTF